MTLASFVTEYEPVIRVCAEFAVPIIAGVFAAVQSKYSKQGADATSSATHNAAVQSAITNFGADLLTEVESGRLSVAGIKSGAATKDLANYLNKNLPDAMNALLPDPATLTTMLVAKMKLNAPANTTITVQPARVTVVPTPVATPVTPAPTVDEVATGVVDKLLSTTTSGEPTS